MRCSARSRRRSRSLPGRRDRWSHCWPRPRAPAAAPPAQSPRRRPGSADHVEHGGTVRQRVTACDAAAGQGPSDVRPHRRASRPRPQRLAVPATSASSRRRQPARQHDDASSPSASTPPRQAVCRLPDPPSKTKTHAQWLCPSTARMSQDTQARARRFAEPGLVLAPVLGTAAAGAAARTGPVARARRPAISTGAPCRRRGAPPSSWRGAPRLPARARRRHRRRRSRHRTSQIGRRRSRAPTASRSSRVTMYAGPPRETIGRCGSPGAAAARAGRRGVRRVSGRRVWEHGRPRGPFPSCTEARPRDPDTGQRRRARLRLVRQRAARRARLDGRPIWSRQLAPSTRPSMQWGTAARRPLSRPRRPALRRRAASSLFALDARREASGEGRRAAAASCRTARRW